MLFENNMDDKKLSFLTADDVIIRFQGETLSFVHPIGRDVNRYFLPLFEFVRHLGGNVEVKGRKIYILLYNDSPIYIDNNSKYTTVSEEIYISLFDLCRILNIKTRWDYDSRSISLYLDKEKHVQKTVPKGRVAFIRLEDVTAGNEYIASVDLEKFRVVADYMYWTGIPFHIAWIPRFIDPHNGIDNDISRDYSIPNAHFVFTIEYLLSRGGIIGLHGYTHQYGDELSGDGTEFSEKNYTDEKSIRERVESAIGVAKILGFPFKFFESPHYASTSFQQSIYELYFEIIYEGCVGIWGDKIVRSPRNNTTLYIPTPLGYVEGENGIEKMIDRINDLGEDTLASLFYHPYAEFEYITLRNDDTENSTDTYSENSPLHRMVEALLDNGFMFSTITEMIAPIKKNCILLEKLQLWIMKILGLLRK